MFLLTLNPVKTTIAPDTAVHTLLCSLDSFDDHAVNIFLLHRVQTWSYEFENTVGGRRERTNSRRPLHKAVMPPY